MMMFPSNIIMLEHRHRSFQRCARLGQIFLPIALGIACVDQHQIGIPLGNASGQADVVADHQNIAFPGLAQAINNQERTVTILFVHDDGKPIGHLACATPVLSLARAMPANFSKRPFAGLFPIIKWAENERISEILGALVPKAVRQSATGFARLLQGGIPAMWPPLGDGTKIGLPVVAR